MNVDINMYKLDYKLTKEIFEKHKDKIQLNMCYKNIYLSYNSPELQSYNLEIAYGFLLDEGICSRHCFIFLKDCNVVVDPTAFLFLTKAELEINAVRYCIIKTFNTTEYLIETLRSNDLSLTNLLIEKEIKMHDKLMKYGYKRNEYEVDDFIISRLETITI